jgi:hypothetical protein
MWRVMRMGVRVGWSCLSTEPRELNEAIAFADQYNKDEGNVGRYFVVSEQEYQEYWRNVVK